MRLYAEVQLRTIRGEYSERKVKCTQGAIRQQFRRSVGDDEAAIRQDEWLLQHLLGMGRLAFENGLQYPLKLSPYFAQSVIDVRTYVVGGGETRRR